PCGRGGRADHVRDPVVRRPPRRGAADRRPRRGAAWRRARAARPRSPGLVRRPARAQVRAAGRGLAWLVRRRAPRRRRGSLMWQYLRLESLGVIEEAELELGPGFTVITGETGAGKTMVVTALGLLRGERADLALIRRGADRARIEASVVATPEVT